MWENYLETINYSNYPSVEYSHKLRIRTIEKLIPSLNQPEIKALDIGCRLGEYSIMLLDKGFRTFSVDISSYDLFKFNKFLKYNKTKDIFIMKMSAHHLGFDNNIFDLIVFSEVIYLLDHPEMAMSEIYRVLKPNGTLIYSQNNSVHLDYIKRLFNYYSNSKSIRKEKYKDMLFPFWRSVSLFKKMGFHIKNIIGIPVIPWKINKYVMKFINQRKIETLEKYLSNQPLVKYFGKSIIIRGIKPIVLDQRGKE